MQLGSVTSVRQEPKVCTLIEQFRSFKRYSMHSKHQMSLSIFCIIMCIRLNRI